MSQIDPERLFRAALEEPAPPAPPEPIDDDDGDGGHHLCVVQPVLLVFGDGAFASSGWRGSALVGWCVLASAVTVWLAVQTIWAWLTLPNAKVAVDWAMLGVGVLLVAWSGTNLIRVMLAWWRLSRRAKGGSARLPGMEKG